MEVNKADAAYQWQWSKDGNTWRNCTSAGGNTDTFGFVMKDMGIPTFPLLNLLELFAKIRAGYSFKKDASPIDCIKNTKLPFFFVHGKNDDFVPTYMMQPLYEACPTEKEKLIIPDADHARSVKYHPELYWPPVWAFIEKYI